MNISTDIKSVTYLRSRTADLLKQINETGHPVVITQNGEPRAVLQDPKSYDNMRNAIGILKLLLQGEDDIRNGRSKPHKDISDHMEKSLTNGRMSDKWRAQSIVCTRSAHEDRI